MRTVAATTLLVLFCTARAASALAGDVVKVQIRDLGFDPASISVHVGDIVEWTNNDFIDHTATARQGDLDLAVPAGKTARWVMTKTGEIAYYCRFHPNMTATIDVLPQ